MATKIKINDKVFIIAGKEKGKVGKVIQVLPQGNKIVVEGVNVMYKHLRTQKKGDKGQRVQFNGPLNISNVLLNCPKCGKNSRVGFQVSSLTGEDKKSVKKTKVRICKKCQEVID
jgi:large subunit ribosomal protein L24